MATLTPGKLMDIRAKQASQRAQYDFYGGGRACGGSLKTATATAPGSALVRKLAPMIVPSGSQAALERLTPTPRGKAMSSIIAAAPQNTLPQGPGPVSTVGDVSRWVNVAGDGVGKPTAAWVAEALRRRREHTTTTDMPSVPEAVEVLEHPSDADESGPEEMGRGGSLLGRVASGMMKSFTSGVMNLADKVLEGKKRKEEKLRESGGSVKSGLVKHRMGDVYDRHPRQFKIQKVKEPSKSLQQFADNLDEIVDHQRKHRLYAERAADNPSFLSKKRKRASPGPESSTMRRAALVRYIMKDQGIGLIEASKYVKAQGLKY